MNSFPDFNINYQWGGADYSVALWFVVAFVGLSILAIITEIISYRMKRKK